MRSLAALLLVGIPALASSISDCRALDHHGKATDAQSCFERLTRAGDLLVRAEALFGLERFQEANDAFRQAEHAQPQSAVVKTEWGNLFFSHSQPSDAAKLYQEAVVADANYAPAYIGLARAAAENFDKAAVELSQQALQRDPKSVEAHELLAYLALEDSDRKRAAEEANAALGLSKEALDAMAVMASMDWLDGKTDSEWTARMASVNPVYGEGYATGAHFLVINRRYQEGVALYRKALELKPALWAARSQLGLNLMRLGDLEGGKQQLERCYEAHFRDPQTVNALRLLDKLSDYETISTPSAQILVSKKESALLGPYFQPELEKAIGVYERKYKMKLPGPVRLEVFPNHEDFIVRTLGLPGQGGLLGVTFGTVVAMDSPSARPPGDFSWAETMWHELSHVYVLTATHNLTPRWFTEGVAVHEERASSPVETERTTPTILEAIKAKKLLPVLELERGFVRPEYQGQVIVSYFEAGRMCDYIVEKWGDGAVLGMMQSFGTRKTTAEAIADNLHVKPEDFDKGFQSWLAVHTPVSAEEQVKWDELKERASTDEKALKNLEYTYLEDADLHRRLGSVLLGAGKADQAVREYRAVLALQPEDAASAHYELARALQAAHKTNEAKDQVLVSLESAPDFKPAQQLLLKLSQ